MSRSAFERAHEALERASESASADSSDRLADQATQMRRFANADSGPDHGRLARHEHILTQIASSEGGDVSDHVEEALAAIRSYRETLEGV